MEKVLFILQANYIKQHSAEPYFYRSFENPLKIIDISVGLDYSGCS